MYLIYLLIVFHFFKYSDFKIIIINENNILNELFFFFNLLNSVNVINNKNKITNKLFLKYKKK